MSAFLELQRSGQLGPACTELLYRTFRSVIRRGGYPPPSGDRWTDDDIIEASHDFLIGPAGVRRITALYLRATDDASLGRLLWTATVNFLRDRARASDRGALQRRLRYVVSDDRNNLVEMGVGTGTGAAWSTGALAGLPPWHGDERTLVSAAWDVDVPVVRYRESRRRDPISDTPSLARVLTAAIERAGAPVPVDVMLRVAEQRFALATPPVVVDLDDEPGSAKDADPAAEFLAQATALDAFNQLSDRERIAVAHIDLGVRELATVLGVSKSTAANVRGRVQRLLASVLKGADDLEAVWEHLERLTVEFAESWTPPLDPASIEGGDQRGE